MPSYVLGWSLLFVIAMGLLLRSYFEIQRWRRARRAKKAMSVQQIADAAKQAIENAPHAKHAPASKSPSPAGASASADPVAPTGATTPSIQGTLAPGETDAGTAALAGAPSWSKLPLPAGAQAAIIAGTLQPVGASWTPPPTVHAEPVADIERPPPRLVVTPPPGPLVIHAPSVAGTTPHADAPAAREGAPQASAPITPSQPRIAATLAPGATYAPQPEAPAPAWTRLPLPDGVVAPNLAATAQPAQAVWTPPPHERYEPPIEPEKTPQPPTGAPLGPLVIQSPSVEGTLPSATPFAAPNDPSPAVKAWIAQPTTTAAADCGDAASSTARSLSASATAPTSTFRIAASRPAPIPRPAPPSWSIVALKTSLPFRVRRPETRLVGNTAKDVVLISKARQQTRVVGRAFKRRLSSGAARPPLVH
ncbi:MAG: hypothetical protein ACT4OU_07295 [Hyphomicrobium sp.]